MTGVFDGLRVLDLSSGVAGPMTTMLLADNGARVTRIQAPDDLARTVSTGARVWDRGKRSAVLDLRSDHDREAFLALAAVADVVVESFAPGRTAALGIDHSTLAATNATLITCSITGYGRHLALRDRPADDALVAAKRGRR